MNAPADFPTQRIVNRLRYWRRHIERAIRDADLMTYEDIERDVCEARKLFFDTPTAFAVIDVQDYSKGRVCHILAAGGSLKGLQELQGILTPFFKEIGARRLTMAGRLGWERTLPTWGWVKSRVLMELEI
jgi:hypothetical protein